MFKNINELLKLAHTHGSVSEAMIVTEMNEFKTERADIIAHMKKNRDVMFSSIEKGIKGVTSVTGLTGGDAKRMDDYLHTSNFLSGEPILKAVRNAIAVNEVNAQMGLICANPTAGSAGVAAGVLAAITEQKNLSDSQQLEFLFTAGAFGLAIANSASISGAAGGCQAEIGSASAMAAAGLVAINGGTPEQSAHAMAMAIKNTLGLICDPVAGLVEVPCVKRNALGASLAYISADMALAGIKSVIPPDEVISAMNQVGKTMPGIFKETAEGGLAVTETAKRISKDIYGS